MSMMSADDVVLRRKRPDTLLRFHGSRASRAVNLQAQAASSQ